MSIYTSSGWQAEKAGNGKVIITAPDGRQWEVSGWISQGRIYVPAGEVTVFGGPRYIVEAAGLGKPVAPKAAD